MGADRAAPAASTAPSTPHLEVDRAMSDFLGMEGAMLYSGGVSADDREDVDANERMNAKE